MRTLHLSPQEVEELLEYDRQVDCGKTTKYDLDAEHAKVAKEMTNIETHKRRNKSEKPTETTEKSIIIDELVKFLEDNENFFATAIEVINSEREIKFKIDDNTYQLTLIQRRK